MANFVDEKENVIGSSLDRLGQKFQLFGVEFAPLILPIERRLQMLAVILWSCTFCLSGLLTCSALIYIGLYTNYWPLTVLYSLWYLYDRDTCNQGGRRFEFLRRAAICRHFVNYFPVRLVKTAELDPNKGNYLLGSHPHGLLCTGAFACFATEATEFSHIFPGITPSLLTLEGFHQVPGFRELLMLTGTCAATSKNLDCLMANKEGGRAAILVVGGAREVLNQDHSSIDLIIKNRKGFIKKALQHGASLVPTFSFGEAFIFDPLVANPKGSTIRSVQEWILDTIRFPFPLFFGRGIFQYTFGSLPNRKPITVVVGQPIRVQKKPEPSTQEVEALHSRYLQQLRKLYEKYNPVYGEANVELHFT